jgi:hypothetical protein
MKTKVYKGDPAKKEKDMIAVCGSKHEFGHYTAVELVTRSQLANPVLFKKIRRLLKEQVLSVDIVYLYAEMKAINIGTIINDQIKKEKRKHKK